jgi:hypothetical protein
MANQELHLTVRVPLGPLKTRARWQLARIGGDHPIFLMQEAWAAHAFPGHLDVLLDAGNAMERYIQEYGVQEDLLS